MRWLLALLVAVLPASAGTPLPPPAPVQISFWSESDGLAVWERDSTIGVTRDGGRTWRAVRDFSGEVSVSAVAGTRTAFATTPLGVFATHDRGSTWSRVSRRVLLGPSFATARVGWAVGDTFDHELVLSTRDGGRTWHARRGPCVPFTTIAVSLASATRGWVVCSFQPGAGQQPKEVWSTRDAGASWQIVARATPWGKRVGRGLEMSGYPRGIEMTAGGAGWLWMARGSFFATRDGGRSWTWLPISSPEIVEGRSASLLTAKVGYALFGHRPALRFTRDGGRMWTVVRRWSR